MNQWQTMENAPKDQPIIAWCNHENSDAYFVNPTTLTTFGAHAEVVQCAEDGLQIVEWGGEYHEGEYSMSAWWFVRGTDFEVVANPIYWMLPEPPETL